MREGLVVIIGSGELGPSMRTTYRHLLEHVAADSVTILDTPYGFQENADDLTSRIEKHFRDGFGVATRVATLRRAGASAGLRDKFLDEVAGAEVVFAGPGSPSYANRIWQEVGLGRVLAEIVDRGGAVVMASAAAVTMGNKAIPVYEIYKVGADPEWLDGLDFLSRFGLSVAVVPHWNNQEGGFHDTSHCFIGAVRFRELVGRLPSHVSVLGVDEHTSLSLHARTGVMRVLGAGEAHFNDIPFADSMVAPGFVARPALPAPAPPPSEPHPWAPVVDLLVELRSEARDRGNYGQSDLIRDRLAAAGIELRDGPERTEWSAADDR